jgi:hypothetical protein
MMAETGPRARRSDARVPRRRRGRAVGRLAGFAYLAIAVIGVAFALVTWRVGRLNPINALVFALVVIGTAPAGLMALRGDYPGARMDEGQREMSRAAQSDAFYVAYLGLYVLFFVELFSRGTPLAIQAATGALLLLVSLTWMGGYMWRRWRP